MLLGERRGCFLAFPNDLDTQVIHTGPSSGLSGALWAGVCAEDAGFAAITQHTRESRSGPKRDQVMNYSSFRSPLGRPSGQVSVPQDQKRQRHQFFLSAWRTAPAPPCSQPLATLGRSRVWGSIQDLEHFYPKEVNLQDLSIFSQIEQLILAPDQLVCEWGERDHRLVSKGKQVD